MKLQKFIRFEKGYIYIYILILISKGRNRSFAKGTKNGEGIDTLVKVYGAYVNVFNLLQRKSSNSFMVKGEGR